MLPRLAAGGSLLLATASRRLPASRLRLAAELAVIATGAPFAFGYAVYHLDVPFTLMVFALLAVCVVYLVTDRSFSFPREFARGIRRRELISIAILFLAAGSLVATWVMLDDPRQLFSLPTNRPDAWLSLVLLYPLLSALPQEIAYRTFFFHRYAPLFAGRPWLAVAANGALFGFAHVIYGSLVSIGLSAVLGLVLAWRYWRTRSLWLVWLEHALWGNFVFTIGLGHYFMTTLPLK
ncbi:MAG TPA: CPBP family intramembrane glutamic endopeptidase [Pseudolabrys sp.]|nr:CPBP family intramembrane glutamic endopeptidase [Pseudolabrys sp.]